VIAARQPIGNKWLVGLRILMAIGFALLGWIELPKRL
jgi:hypothetical protein